MKTQSGRQWELPARPWVMRMTWSELLFAHWAVEPRAIADRLPRGLTLDTRDDRAWIGVVPFLMSDVAPRCCPALPGLSRFLELNVRTYVTRDGKPGVWFFSLDAANRIAVRVARATFNLPYMDARMRWDKDHSGTITYHSSRTHRGEPSAEFEACYRSTGENFHAQHGSLEHWLTARYCLYSADRRGRLYRGEIDHEPWTLAPATCTLNRNTMCDSLQMNLAAPPHLLFAQPIQVNAWPATRLD